MSGIPAETLLLCLVCGVLLGFAFAVLEFLRLLFSLGKIAAAVTVTHGICRFLPYAERRLHGFRNRIFAKYAQGRRKKVEALLKSGKKHKSFLNKSKKSKKRT